MLLLLETASWAVELPIVGILAGLVMLVGGAELLVRGAVWIALALGMTRMTVGLTLVAIGTSLPELLVSLTAAQTGREAIAMGNVIGSNVANVLLIIGAAATIRAVQLHVRALELGYFLLTTALACVPFFLGARLERWMSAVMIAVLALFLMQLLARERVAKKLVEEAPLPLGTAIGWVVHTALLAGGFVALKYGADWLVDGASAIAKDLGMSDAVIGMTVVAVGTSLPELATSVIAALRGQPEICVGNVIGSNIFNVGAVLGVTGLLQPFGVDVDDLTRLMWSMVASALVLFVVLNRKRGVPRWVGVAFLAAYVGLMTFEVLNCPPA